MNPNMGLCYYVLLDFTTSVSTRTASATFSYYMNGTDAQTHSQNGSYCLGQAV